MQQWCNLSDPAMEDGLYVSESMRKFAMIDPDVDVVHDESAILRVRHLFEKHGLAQGLCDAVRDLLERRGLLVKAGTIADATILEAPPSTKNAQKARDSEMRHTRKGPQWHFWIKVHVGTDRR